MQHQKTAANQISTLSGTGLTVKQEIVNGTSIRSLQNSEPLKKCLARVFVLIGLKNDQIPNPENTQVLIDFIRRRYANYTANEIVIAFEMAIIGDFKADTEHFGQFTAKYLSGVLNSYQEYRNRVALQVQIEAEKLKKHQSPEEIQRRVDEFYGEAVDLYRQSVTVYEGSKYHANVIYDTLKKHYTTEQLLEFKRISGEKMQSEKSEFEELKRKYLPIPDYLKNATFTRNEWRRRTALMLVNDALTKNIEL